MEMSHIVMYEILPLCEEWCEEVYQLAKECLSEHWSLQGIQDVLKYDNYAFFVAKQKDTNEIIGFVGIMINVDEAELLNIAVKKTFRRLGVAQALLMHVLKLARKEQAKRMLLEVRMNNTGAISLYKKNGFCDLAVRKNYYFNPREDALIMECIL